MHLKNKKRRKKKTLSMIRSEPDKIKSDSAEGPGFEISNTDSVIKPAFELSNIGSEAELGSDN